MFRESISRRVPLRSRDTKIGLKSCQTLVVFQLYKFQLIGDNTTLLHLYVLKHLSNFYVQFHITLLKLSRWFLIESHHQNFSTLDNNRYELRRKISLTVNYNFNLIQLRLISVQVINSEP